MNRFHYVLAFYRKGALAGQAPLAPAAFEPALEWLEFEAVRRGRLPPRLGRRRAWSATPIWDAARGAPHVAAARVVLEDEPDPSNPGAGRLLAACVAPAAAFELYAQEAAAALARTGELGEGAVVVYRVLAYPRTAPAPAAASPGCVSPGAVFGSLEAIEQELPLRETRLDALLARAEAHDGPDRDGAMPLFVSRQVLREAAARKQEAGAAETGGILLGRLHRDAVRPEIFVEVTAEIPARHARAGAHRLEFTPETWTAVRSAIARRGQEELWVGWWHSHPARAWCGRCDPACRPTCPLTRAFFSAADRRLHQAVFPRAYSVALVLGDRVGEDGIWKTSCTAYGWDRGALRPRGYHVTDT